MMATYNATCGLAKSDIEAHKRFLAYCNEYDNAWTKYVDEIAEVARKFDGKKVTKRIDTAIKKIDERLSFRIDRSFSTWVYVEWYDYEGRVYHDEPSGCWEYVPNTTGASKPGFMSKVVDPECFDAEVFIKEMMRVADYLNSASSKTQDAIDNLESLKEQYNNAIFALHKVQNEVPGLIAKYYNLDRIYINEWR